MPRKKRRNHRGNVIQHEEVKQENIANARQIIMKDESLQKILVKNSISMRQIPKARKSGARMLKTLINDGSAVAQLSQALLYLNENASSQNRPEGLRLLKLAAGQGYGPALGVLGAFCTESEVEEEKREALMWFRLGVEKGDAISQCFLAGYYSEGIEGVVQDHQEALRLLELSAAQGNEDAQYKLAVHLLFGIHITRDNGRGMELLESAANKGVGLAQLLLGERCLGSDEIKARQFLIMASAQGLIEAQRVLGIHYLAKKQVLVQKEGVRLLMLAAEDPETAYLLYHCYLKGLGVAKNDEKARQFLLQSAAKEWHEAQQVLGFYYLEGHFGFEKNIPEAITLLKAATSQKNQAAQDLLATCYEIGEGVSQNLQEAIRLWAELVEQNYLPAKIALSRLLWEGLGIPEDKNRAKQYLQEASSAGSCLAQYTLARIYFADKEMQIRSQAFPLFVLATNSGQENAAYYLGQCYEKGIGCKKDPIQAKKYFEQAANKGDSIAKYELGKAYLYGCEQLDMQPDFEKAVSYLEQSKHINPPTSSIMLGEAYLRRNHKGDEWKGLDKLLDVFVKKGGEPAKAVIEHHYGTIKAGWEKFSELKKANKVKASECSATMLYSKPGNKAKVNNSTRNYLESNKLS